MSGKNSVEETLSIVYFKFGAMLVLNRLFQAFVFLFKRIFLLIKLVLVFYSDIDVYLQQYG